MKNLFKTMSEKQTPEPIPKFNLVDAQLIMDRIKPLYEQLEKLGIAKDIHGTGAMLDRKTHTAYVFIQFPLDYTVNFNELPQSYDNIEIRYEKIEYATFS